MVQFTKEQRANAKAKGSYLVCLSINGQYRTDESERASIELRGLCSDEFQAKVMELIQEWARKDQAE